MLPAINKPKSGRKKVLSKEEIRSLIRKAQSGDVEAMREAIGHNYGLIIKTAKKYQKYSHLIEFSDLFQEGVVALIRAIRLFDLKKKVRFSTYAIWWIKQHMFRCIEYNSHATHVPIYITSEYKRIVRKKGKNLKISRKEQEFLDIYNGARGLSMDKIMVDKGSYHNIIESKQVKSEDLYNYDLETLYDLAGIVGRNRNIFRMRARGMTLQDIGTKNKLSRERVRQIIKKGTDSMAKHIKQGGDNAGNRG